MPPTLETERLLIRPWRDADVEPWVALGADPRVMEFFPGPSDRDQAETTAARMRARLERDGYGWWIVEIKGQVPFAGVVALQRVPFDAHFTPALEIGWRLVHAHWGCGFATEAARSVLAYAFDDLEQTEVVAITAAINQRSRRVMQKLGMTYDPQDDFDNPFIDAGHRLERHVLYRAKRAGDPSPRS